MFVKSHVVLCIMPNGDEREIEFRIHQDRHTQKYFADANGLGTSRDHAYWIHAVDELTRAHCVKQLCVR
jgi:hypothetical protein